MAQAFQFASPSNYSDWANYAGFDRTTGEQSNYVPGAVSPTNLSEFVNQAVAPAQQKMNMLTGVVSNLSQGNMMGAYNAYKPKTQPTPVNNGFAYHIDDLEP